jgi:hypothetical protein
MLEAWELSSKFHCRPSDLYGIEHPVRAFFFDRAVYTFGTALESDLAASTEKSKKPAQAKAIRQRVMAKWLGGFREPSASEEIKKKGW